MQQQSRKHRIRGPILGPLAAAVAILMVAVVAGLYWLAETENQNQINCALGRVQALFRQQLAGEADALDIALYGVASKHGFAAPLRDRDRARLAGLVQPLYEHFHEDHRITHFYVDDAERVNLLRAHDPERFGDRIDRSTTLAAERDGGASSGIEVGVLGSLTLRVVMPYRQNGQVLGYLELGEEIGHIIDSIHQILSVEVVVLLDKRLLDASNWEKGRQLFGWPLRWDRFPAVAVTASTFDQFDQPLLDLIGQASHTGNLPASDLRLGGRILHFAPLPLQDASGQRVGSLLVGVDLTQFTTRSRHLMTIIALLCLALGTGLVIFFHRLLGRVEGRVHCSIEQMARANADLERVAFVATNHLHQPVNQVLHATQALRQGCGGHLAGQCGLQLEALVEASREIRETVGALEDYLDLGVTGHRQEPVALRAVLNATLEQLHSGLRDAQVTVEPLPTVAGNPVLLARAFFCLVENAIVGTAPERPLHLAVTAEGEADRWTIIFADNGAGAGDAGQAARLEAVARVAAAHGGDIAIDRRAGIGTTVRMSLGARREQATEAIS